MKLNTGVHSTKDIVDYIHFDLWGPSPVLSKGAFGYLMIFIDDYSRKVWMYSLKSKDQVFVNFKQFRDLIEKQTEKKIMRLRTNNALEYC